MTNESYVEMLCTVALAVLPEHGYTEASMESRLICHNYASRVQLRLSREVLGSACAPDSSRDRFLTFQGLKSLGKALTWPR